MMLLADYLIVDNIVEAIMQKYIVFNTCLHFYIIATLVPTQLTYAVQGVLCYIIRNKIKI